MNQHVADLIKAKFERLTGIVISAKYMEKGHTHCPTMLQAGMCGVYAFTTETHCFKVGKAGPKSKARWNSHHYCLDETTPSTMTKSIMKHKVKVKAFFPQPKHAEINALSKETIQAWVKNNLARIEFLMPMQSDNFALGLLEALAQYRLKPIFEGKSD